MTDIDLSQNDLNNFGANQIAGILKKFTKIKTCDISSNGIGSDGMQKICSGLCNENSKLEHLDIQDNPISDKSLKMLMAMLLHNTSILEINYTLKEANNI